MARSGSADGAPRFEAVAVIADRAAVDVWEAWALVHAAHQEVEDLLDGSRVQPEK
jgi:hypothetical protein